jgi:hypothetical protein
MPPTVSVAAFVFGVVLLLAALIGKELKVVTVELPALGPGRRIVLGLLGLALTLFGLFDGQAPGWPATAPTLATPAAQPVVNAASAAAPAREGVLSCLADVAGDDLVILPMDPTRRTDRTWSGGQPRTGLLAMQFEDSDGIRGGVKFQTLESAAGFDIVGVYDAACQPLATYANVSDPSQPKDHPSNFETMRYQISDFVYAGDISYTEGGARIAVRIQQTAP